jgi:hypothetical protein
MVSKSRKKRLFDGMDYRELQCSNTQRKKLLTRADQVWLKSHQYKNSGWENVIKLHQKINALLSSYQEDDLSLEDLFLEADRIGNKYQTTKEINAFHQALSATVESISQQVDHYFPDEESEMIDYRPRQPESAKVRKAKGRKR